MGYEDDIIEVVGLMRVMIMIKERGVRGRKRRTILRKGKGEL
jgi:hypothetical protein